MADQPSRSKKKRTIRNPETFRERAIKATSEKEDKPTVRGYLKSWLRPVFRPIWRGLKWFFTLKLFKPFRRPVRLIGLILLPRYFRNSWKELKLVTWPNWKLSRQLTFAVLVFAVVFGASIAAVDYGLDRLFKNILLK